MCTAKVLTQIVLFVVFDLFVGAPFYFPFPMRLDKAQVRRLRCGRYMFCLDVWLLYDTCFFHRGNSFVIPYPWFSPLPCVETLRTTCPGYLVTLPPPPSEGASAGGIASPPVPLVMEALGNVAVSGKGAPAPPLGRSVGRSILVGSLRCSSVRRFDPVHSLLDMSVGGMVGWLVGWLLDWVVVSFFVWISDKRAVDEVGLWYAVRTAARGEASVERTHSTKALRRMVTSITFLTELMCGLRWSIRLTLIPCT